VGAQLGPGVAGAGRHLVPLCPELLVLGPEECFDQVVFGPEQPVEAAFRDPGALHDRVDADVPDVTEILVHWGAGRSQSEIATSLGLDCPEICVSAKA
jgi:hypothetical protein